MRKHHGKYRYHSLNILKEALFFTISLVVYFPLHIKKIYSFSIFSKYYKAQNVHSLLEKEDFSSNCINDLDTNLSPKYERRDDFCITILKVICHILGIKVRIHHLWVITFYLVRNLLLSILKPRWFSNPWCYPQSSINILQKN